MLSSVYYGVMEFWGYNRDHWWQTLEHSNVFLMFGAVLQAIVGVNYYRALSSIQIGYLIVCNIVFYVFCIAMDLEEQLGIANKTNSDNGKHDTCKHQHHSDSYGYAASSSAIADGDGAEMTQMMTRMENNDLWSYPYMLAVHSIQDGERGEEEDEDEDEEEEEEEVKNADIVAAALFFANSCVLQNSMHPKHIQSTAKIHIYTVC